MVSVEKAVIARISKNNVNFEVLVDPDKALLFKKGSPGSVENMLAVNEIFKDSKKGERASGKDLEDAFGTTDTFKIAEIIIKKGDVQLTTDQKRKLTEEKRTEIANIISKQGVDPKTHIPHPANRILNAMTEAHVDIDPFKPAREQVNSIINKIQEIIPISFEKVTLAIMVPLDLAGKAGHVIREIGDIKKEEWKSNAWYCMLTVPAAMQADIYDRINSVTSGQAEVKVVKREEL